MDSFIPSQSFHTFDHESLILESEMRVKELSRKISASHGKLTSTERAKSGDWVESYNIMDKFIDVEDLNAEILKEEEKLFNLKQQHSFTGHSHDHAIEREIFMKSNNEKINLCDRYAILAERLFVEGNHTNSLLQYKTALAFSEYIFPEDDETLSDQLDSIRHKCLCRVASNLYFLKAYREALNYINMAIREGQHSQAFVTRGRIHHKMHEYK